MPRKCRHKEAAEKAKIESQLRLIVDSVQNNDNQTILDVLADDFIVEEYGLTKDDFKSKGKGSTHIRDVEDVTLRSKSISIDENKATVKTKVRVTFARIGRQATLGINAELAKIDGKWLFPSAKVLDLTKKLKQ